MDNKIEKMQETVKQALEETERIEREVEENFLRTENISIKEIEGFLDKFFPKHSFISRHSIIANEWGRKAEYLSQVIDRLQKKHPEENLSYEVEYAKNLALEIKKDADKLLFVSDMEEVKND